MALILVVAEELSALITSAPSASDIAAAFRARVSREAVRTANRFSGQDEIAAGRVWIAAVLSPTIDDRITLPDGTQPVIVNWNVVSDEVASHHTVIFFGATQATRSA
jgi:hypothetical protein